MRSTYNVGSLLRTADGLGVSKLIFTGYTPYPKIANDTRLPHVIDKLSKQIHKTALGAETYTPWQYKESIDSTIMEYKSKGFVIVALEQAVDAVYLPDFNVPDNLVIILGEEVKGISPDVLRICDNIVEIPMLGQKESFNVVQAAAIMLYHCRYII